MHLNLIVLIYLLGSLCFKYYLLWSWSATAKHLINPRVLIDCKNCFFHPLCEMKISRIIDGQSSKSPNHLFAGGVTIQAGEKNSARNWSFTFPQLAKYVLQNIIKNRKGRSKQRNHSSIHSSCVPAYSGMPCVVTCNLSPKDWSFGTSDPRRLVFWDFLTSNLWGEPKKVWSLARAPKKNCPAILRKLVFSKNATAGPIFFLWLPEVRNGPMILFYWNTWFSI